MIYLDADDVKLIVVSFIISAHYYHILLLLYLLFSDMEIPLAQIYVSFSLLSTLAFIYLIYNFFIRDIKNTSILNSST